MELETKMSGPLCCWYYQLQLFYLGNSCRRSAIDSFVALIFLSLTLSPIEINIFYPYIAKKTFFFYDSISVNLEICKSLIYHVHELGGIFPLTPHRFFLSQACRTEVTSAERNTSSMMSQQPILSAASPPKYNPKTHFFIADGTAPGDFLLDITGLIGL